MCDPETGNWIVFNGEIYNFRMVRSRLEQAGRRFNSQTDTEVVLKAYGCWGAECLQHFRGMFAIAIWDSARRQLFLARDRFGEKPLYYSLRDGNLLFGSEVRSLLATGLVQPIISEAGLVQFLGFGSVCDPVTLVDGVRSLPPAHYAVWKDGELQATRYWSLENTFRTGTNTEWAQMPLDCLRERIRDAVEEAVVLRTVSDVPIGVFLSGGIDSGALVSILSGRPGAALNTFSIVFPESDYSEAEFSRNIAHHFGTEHHELRLCRTDALECVTDAIAAMDQPTIDGVNTFMISRRAAEEGLKVALSGLGADELFAGYSTFRTVPLMERIAWLLGILGPRLRKMLSRVCRLLATSNKGVKVARLLSDPSLHPYSLMRGLFIPGQRDRLLLRVNPAAIAEADAPMHDCLWHSLRFDPINRVSSLELQNYMTNTLLRDTDSMSMAHSLEVRVPFVDHVLAELLFSLPGSAKVQGATPKHLLVGSLRKSLPIEVVNRHKRGFTLPFEHWLRTDLRQEVEKVLLSDTSLNEWIDRREVRKVWTGFLTGKLNWSRPWSLYVLGKWASSCGLS